MQRKRIESQPFFSYTSFTHTHTHTHKHKLSHMKSYSILHGKIGLLLLNNLIINSLPLTLGRYHLIKLSALTRQRPHTKTWAHKGMRTHTHTPLQICQPITCVQTVK